VTILNSGDVTVLNDMAKERFQHQY